MTLTAIYVAANEAANLAESMRSVKAYVDRFVVVDAIFHSNPDPCVHSSDGQRDVARAAAGDVPLTYYQSAEKLRETDARNVALAFLDPGDRGLIIDGDECLYGDHGSIVTLLSSDSPAIAIPVYTTAVLFDGYAPEMSAEEYDTNPLISTSAYMVRIFRMETGLHYVLPSGHITPMLADIEGEVILPTLESDAAFILNRHATQPFDVYQNDFVWETGARAP